VEKIPFIRLVQGGWAFIALAQSICETYICSLFGEKSIVDRHDWGNWNIELVPQSGRPPRK
jgi:hypothetical protein